MKICRFDEHRLGLVEGDQVRDVTAALDCLPAHRYPLPTTDPLITHWDRLRAAIAQLAPTAACRPLAGLRLLPPVANPGKIIAAPVNYTKHLDEARAQAEIHHHQQIAEIRQIGLFLKANSSLIGASQAVELQHPERRNDHEAELVAVIGKTGRNIGRAQALDHVAGYCIGLDMTVRGPQERSLRKSIDTYSVLGPWMVTADELPDPGAIAFWLTVNGEPRQRAHTRDLVLDIPALIEMASSYYTLHPGDLLFTGTPEGVGPVTDGDVIDVHFEGIGSMQIHVRHARRATP